MNQLIATSLILFFSASVYAQMECPHITEKMMDAHVITCATPESFALPKYKYSMQFGEGIEYKKSLTVKGYVQAATGFPIQFNTPRALEADLMFDASFVRPAGIKANGLLEVAGMKFHNAIVTHAFVSTAAVIPSHHVPFVIPEAKISVLKADALHCQFTDGQLRTEATCELVRIDQGQYNCDCQYKLLD